MKESEVKEMEDIIIVTESGADISAFMKEQLGIYILPMHVVMGDRNLDDGTFPVKEIFDYYKKNKKLPSTSATNPDEYFLCFKKIHEKYPEKKILHLCYSAVTTATFQNSLIASEGMDYVYHLDTKNVSGGQAAIVKKAAEYLRKHPHTSMEEMLERTKEWVDRARFAFFPGDLAYLKAGGRVSNAQYLGAALLNLKPLIELKNGYLIGTKKYRGNMEKSCRKMVLDMIEQYHYEKDLLWFLYSEGLEQTIRMEMEKLVKENGYSNVEWIKTGGVITVHSGPGAFGIIGFEPAAGGSIL